MDGGAGGCCALNEMCNRPKAQTSGLWFPKGVTQPGHRFTWVLPIFSQFHFTHFLPILPGTRYPPGLRLPAVKPKWVLRGQGQFGYLPPQSAIAFGCKSRK